VPTEGVTVEVKIGITDSPRELVLSSAQTPAEVEELVGAALGGGSGLLRLSDERGRRYLIHSAKIAYVEIGVADSRRVGFGIGAEVAKLTGKAAKGELAARVTAHPRRTERCPRRRPTWKSDGRSQANTWRNRR